MDGECSSCGAYVERLVRSSVGLLCTVCFHELDEDDDDDDDDDGYEYDDEDY